MADVFISYAREDLPKIEKLAAALEADGFSLWWDRHIAGGAEFSKDIERELGEAKTAVVAWSAHSIQSRWVRDEAVTAADTGKLIPVLVDDTPAPMGFKQFQSIDLSRWRGDADDEAFKGLSRAISARLADAGVARAAPATAPAAARSKNIPKRSLAAIAAAILALIAGLAFFQARKTPGDGAKGAAAPASVAVLPFVDLSPEGDQAYFSDGVSEEILNVLSRIPNLKVAGRTSSFSFKGKNEDLRDIGAALGVNHVLEGSVRKSGAKLRITAQLIRSDDGFHIWSETYERELTDIFDIQEDIAKSVADELALSLGLKTGQTLVTDRTQDVDAYEKYLKAKNLYRARGLENLNAALLLLSEVTARDPDFAPAWSLIAGVYGVYEAYQALSPPAGDWRQWRSIGRAAAKRAIALDPRNAEAYVFLGTFEYYDRDYTGAMESMDRALELAPDNAEVLDPVAQTICRLGYFREAESLAKRAIAIDPLVPIFRNTLANIYVFGGRTFHDFDADAAAIAGYRKAIELDPKLQFPYGNMFWIYFRQKKFDEAAAVVDEGVAAGAGPADRAGKARAVIAAARRGGEALRNQYSGDGGVGDKSIAAQLGDVDLFIEAASKSWTGEYSYEPTLLIQHFGPAFKDPRWKAAMKSSGILDLWRKRGFPEWCRPLGENDFECD